MSERRPKVLVLASTYPRWSGDHQPEFVHRLCRSLAVGRDITVLAPAASGAAASEILDGVNVVRYAYAPHGLQTLAYGGGLLANLRSKPWRAALLPGLLASLWTALRRALRDESWDVVHAHWSIPQGAVAASVLNRLPGRRPRLILTVHGSDLLKLRGGPWDVLNRYALCAADAVTAVGPELEARAREFGVAKERLHRLPMGVDTEERFVPEGHFEEAASPRFLFVGRLVPEKGPDLPIRALPAVLQCEPDAHLEIVGDGPDRGGLERLVERLGLTGKVSFHGALPPELLPQRYRAATVCVVPSRSEGLGLVALEAMACGRPVVVSDLPSLREIAERGEAAVMIPAGDPGALAEALIALLRDRDRREALGMRARERSLAFSWDVVSRNYGRLLERVAQSET